MTATQRAVVDDLGNINVHGRSALEIVWKVKDAEGSFINISASDLFVEIATKLRIALVAGEDNYSRKLTLTRAQIATLPLNQPLDYALHDETPSSPATIWNGKITAYGFRTAPSGAAAVDPGTASWTGATVTVMQGESVPTVVVTYMGATGYGIPTGGTVGQYIRKASATNFDTAWDTITADDVSGLSASLSTLTSADASLTSRVSTEETTRATADTSLTTRLSTEEAARGSADTSIVTRFSTADTSLTTRLSTEEVTRASADTSLTSRLATEESARSSADTSVMAAFAASGGSGLVGFVQAGTGAATRTPQAKMRDVLTTADFGAVGDATTDATAAIQAALDAAAAAGGGTVFIPAGIYRISNTLLIPSKVHVRGAGRGATVLRGIAGQYSGKSVNGLTAYITLCMGAVDRASVAHLTVDHATNGCTANGIGCTIDASGNYSTNCTVFDCEITASVNSGYLLWNLKGRYIKYVGNYLHGGYVSGVSTQEGIETFGGLDVLIEGNTVINVGSAGVYCVAEQISGLPAGSSGTTVAARILNNYISGCKRGINITPSETVKNIKVIGNQIFDSSSIGIQMTCASGVTIEDVSINDNTIENAPVGISLGCSSGAVTRKIQVCRNTIENTTDANNGAIYASYLSNAIFAGNQTRTAAGYGLYANTITDCIIDGNRFTSIQKMGMLCDDNTRLRVTNNEFISYDLAAGAEPGMLVRGNTDTLIARNTFRTGGSAAYLVNVSSTTSSRVIVQDNYATGTATTNPVYLNAGLNPNTGTISPTAGATSTTVTNSLAHQSSRILIWQSAGTPLAFSVSRTSGAFTVTWASAAVGNETYQYEIR